MDATAEPRWLKRWFLRNLLAAMFALEAMVIVFIIVSARATRQDGPDETTFNQEPARSWRANHFKPVLRPPVLKVAEAKLRPDEPVIGVEVGGRARAYRLFAINDLTGHLINDVIGGVPVSVAYSNLSDCVRVYTDPRGSAPLDADVPGLLNREMVVKLAGIQYFHNSGKPVDPATNPSPIPYRLLTSTRTSWKEWTKHHPDTDVYVGGR
jgi:hypothetical protein